MGETADQIRDQVDQAREQATDKIVQLEQQVSNATQQVKDNLDWRHQVEERPLVAMGVALVGGMLFGSITGGNGKSSHSSNSSSSSSGGGLGGVVRKAAASAGIEAKVESYAHDFFNSLSKRVGDVASEAFSGLSNSTEPTKVSQSPSVSRVNVSSR